MAVNLTPQYLEAEAEYKRAQTAEERLACLQRMWALVPKHKASEKLQAELNDTPPVTADFLEGYLSGMVRAADACLLVVDLGDDDGPFAAEAVLERLAQAKTLLAGRPPEVVEDPGVHTTRTMLVANKADL